MLSQKALSTRCAAVSGAAAASGTLLVAPTRRANSGERTNLPTRFCTAGANASAVCLQAVSATKPLVNSYFSAALMVAPFDGVSVSSMVHRPAVSERGDVDENSILVIRPSSTTRGAEAA